MVKVTFIEPNGTCIDLEVAEGTTVRDAAVNNTVPGIDGDCGGNCACATCHIYVDDQWIDKVGEAPPGGMEQDLLQLAEDVRLNSRLACQIPLSAELNGLVVHVPFGQH